MSVYLTLAERADALQAASVLACRIARKLDRKLIGVTAMPDANSALMMTGAGTGFYHVAGEGLIRSVEEAQNKIRDDLTDKFGDVCNNEGMVGEMVALKHLTGLPEQILPNEAVLADAFVFPHDCARIEGPHGAAFEYVLMSRRLPVILAGEDTNPNLDTIVIAWDGSPEAAKSVIASEALLRVAKTVIVAQNEDKVDPQDSNGPARVETLTNWLAERGVTARTEMFDGRVVDGLIRVAQEANAGLLVAGAYGHGRIEEMIFGGATRSLLRSEGSPALALAH